MNTIAKDGIQELAADTRDSVIICAKRTRSAAIGNGDNTRVIVDGGIGIAVATGVKCEAIAHQKNATAIATGQNSIAVTEDGLAYAADIGGQASVTQNGIAVAGYAATAVALAPGSVAVATYGYSCAKGVKGSWLIFIDRDMKGNTTNVQSVQVDGVNFIEYMPYRLENGKIVACR